MPDAPPLAVDLDGTLIKGDLFTMAMLRLARERPSRLPLLGAWLLHGRAHAKARLAELYPADPAQLDYDERVVAWLKEERCRGRRIALASAYDRRAAQSVADHLGLFDCVLASDGRVNLKAHRKADALRAAFPEGFVYAGNEAADIPVWRAATHAVIVNAPRWLEQLATREFPIERTFPRGKRIA
jgi:phosphoserine phosphatase